MMGAYNRDVSYRKALRKRRIDRESGHVWRYHVDYYDNLHQYSKNKIHCSCGSCQKKTRNKGRRNRGNYSKSINYKKHRPQWMRPKRLYYIALLKVDIQQLLCRNKRG